MNNSNSFQTFIIDQAIEDACDAYQRNLRYYQTGDPWSAALATWLTSEKEKTRQRLYTARDTALDLAYNGQTQAACSIFSSFLVDQGRYFSLDQLLKVQGKSFLNPDSPHLREDARQSINAERSLLAGLLLSNMIEGEQKRADESKKKEQDKQALAFSWMQTIHDQHKAIEQKALEGQQMAFDLVNNLQKRQTSLDEWTMGVLKAGQPITGKKKKIPQAVWWIMLGVFILMVIGILALFIHLATLQPQPLTPF